MPVTVDTGPVERALEEKITADDLPVKLLALTHALGRLKQQIQQIPGRGEWAYDAILYHVVTLGPLRSGALAHLVQVDPSTASRQVNALIRDGLLERHADPDDGRASLLLPTDLGRARQAEHIARRDAHYQAMLADWTTAERAEFARYLARFTAAFEAHKAAILAEVMSTHETAITRRDNR
jgi:DNA-binding MarR family transcriptional regulator